MSGALSILPLHYDVDFIVQRAGLFNHYGYERREDGIHLRYPIDSYEAVTTEISGYDVNYLEVLLPKKLEEIDTTRKLKILAFKFMGMDIVLDTTTVANMTAACVGLDRYPDRQFINWQYGAGKFMSIPRNLMYDLADASFVYFQGCFDRAMVLTNNALAARDINELNAININSGWPQDVEVEDDDLLIPSPPEEPETDPAVEEVSE